MQKIESANHSPEQVRAIIREAAAIARECYHDGLADYPVFEQACQLLGQKAVIFAEAQPAPLLLDGLRTPGH